MNDDGIKSVTSVSPQPGVSDKEFDEALNYVTTYDSEKTFEGDVIANGSYVKKDGKINPKLSKSVKENVAESRTPKVEETTVAPKPADFAPKASTKNGVNLAEMHPDSNNILNGVTSDLIAEYSDLNRESLEFKNYAYDKTKDVNKEVNEKDSKEGDEIDDHMPKIPDGREM